MNSKNVLISNFISALSYTASGGNVMENNVSVEVPALLKAVVALAPWFEFHSDSPLFSNEFLRHSYLLFEAISECNVEKTRQHTFLDSRIELLNSIDSSQTNRQ